MVVLRVLAGSLLWILAAVVALLGILLSVTIILLPLGIPLLFLARRLFRYSVTLFVPRAVRHPVQEAEKKGRRGAANAAESVGLSGKSVKRARKQGRTTAGKVRRKAGQKLGKKDRSLVGRLKRAN